ncbi:MAG: peptidyl-prolyl cis-trans isomerase [Betaproteobacteria bacterium]|nr:peptidyl-prolyl cis-trans isomerase [Betaproteobacteria bacterium]
MKTLKRVLVAVAACASVSAAAANPQVELKTSMGTIVIELLPERAPRTVENFLQYVKDGFYEGTVFHRVIPRFMLQGGGFTPDFQQKPTRAPVRNEADNGLKNVAGTVAMARTPDPHSATAQFFINVADNDFLNYTAATPQGWGYTVFGRVVKGMDVVGKIAAAATGPGPGPHRDVPVKPILIERARLLGKAEKPSK